MVKKYKRHLSCILSAALVITASFSAVPSSAATYKDVKDAACEEAVAALSDAGIINGYTDGTFRPDDSISRAEISKIISSVMVQSFDSDAAAQLDETTTHADITDSSSMAQTGADFTDVTRDNWAAPYIGISSTCGIITGYTDSSFRPTGKITYNELSAMAVRACEFDMSKVSGAWPANYVAAAQELKLYRGLEDFDPAEDGSKQATRGDAAIIIYNALDTIKAAAADGYSAARTLIPETDEDGNVIETDTDTVKTLSLEEALEIMETTGMLAETAQNNYDADKVTIKTYQDTIHSLNQLIDYGKLIMTTEANGAGTNKKIVETYKTFAEENLDNNHQAELNSIESTTRQMYFGVVQAQENVDVSEDAVEVQKELLAIAQKKHDLGMLSDLALSSQEYSLTSAESTLSQAKQSLQSAVNSFDLLLGYPSGTELVLTTPLEKDTFEMPQLQEAIDSMLDNNLELKLMDVQSEALALQVNSARYTTSTSSASYKSLLSSQTQLTTGIQQLKNSKTTDMTTAYFNITDLENQIDTFQSTIDLTEKSLAVQEKQLELGMITKPDVDQTKLSLLQAKQGLIAAIYNYNQAVTDFNFSMGLGTSRITFPSVSAS